MVRLTREGTPAVIIALPAIAGAAAWIGAIVFTWATGTHPIWNFEPRSLSEAAALRHPAAVVRLIEEGASPDEAGEVRAGVVSDGPLLLTPLEAAVASRESSIVQLVIDEGAAVDGPVWNRAWCRATATDMRDMLLRYRPADGSIECLPSVTIEP